MEQILNTSMSDTDPTVRVIVMSNPRTYSQLEQSTDEMSGVYHLIFVQNPRPNVSLSTVTGHGHPHLQFIGFV